MTRVRRSHHVLRIEHLLREFRHGDRAVLLATARGQRSKANQEEVETREWNCVVVRLAGIHRAQTSLPMLTASFLMSELS